MGERAGGLSRRLVEDFQGVFLCASAGFAFCCFFLIFNSCLDESFGCAK